MLPTFPEVGCQEFKDSRRQVEPKAVSAVTKPEFQG
jgi:hypothetical protein